MQIENNELELRIGRLAYSIRMFVWGVMVLGIGGYMRWNEFLFLMIPILIAMTGVIASLKYAVVLGALLTLITTMVSSLSIPLEIMLLLNAIGLSTAYGILRRKQAEQVILGTTVLSGLLISYWSYYYEKIGKEKITETLFSSYKETLSRDQALSSLVQSMTAMDAEQFLGKTMEILPVAVLGLSLLLALTTYYRSTKTLEKYARKEIFPKFSDFHIPGGPLFVIAVNLFIMLGASAFMGGAYFESISLCLGLFFSILLYVQGLATVVYRTRTTFSKPIRWILVVAMGCFLPMLVVIVGAIDFSFDLRKERQIEE